MAVVGLSGCGGTSVDNNERVDLEHFLVEPDLAKVCVATCTTDTDCQDSCPSPSSGTSCCDTTTNTCYTNAQSVCPAPPDMSIASSY